MDEVLKDISQNISNIFLYFDHFQPAMLVFFFKFAFYA